MRKSLILILFLCLLTVGCTKKKGYWLSLTTDEKIIGYVNKDKTLEVECDPFDTSMLIRYYFDSKANNNEELKQQIIDEYTSEVNRLHKLFDRHYYYFDENGDLINNLKVINDSYGSGNEIVVEKELFDLLKYAINSYELTYGMFNIFTGSLTDFWETCFERAYDYEEVESFDPYYNNESKLDLENRLLSVPNTKELYNAQITLNEENQSVKFNKLAEFDYFPIISLGGIAKGYATDLIKEKFKELNLTNGVLFSGGSSLESLSTPIYDKKEQGLKISVKNPNTFMDPAFELKVKQEFNFSTSGNYTTNKWYRIYDNDGKLIYRHHIINPFTGYPMSYYRSVSILSYSLSSCDLDILSTTLMNIDINKGLELRNKLIEDGNTIELAYLMQNNDDLLLYATDNFYLLKTLEGVEKVYEK